MQIKILGPGWGRTVQAERVVREVVASKGNNILVEKVTDMKQIVALGVMLTPAVVVEGVVKSTGRVPSKEEVSSWIDAAAAGRHI